MIEVETIFDSDREEYEFVQEKKEQPMNEAKLLPCPFCGGEAHLDRHDIFCDCGARIDIPQYVHGKVSIAGFPTYEEAIQKMIDAWNRRATDET